MKKLLISALLICIINPTLCTKKSKSKISEAQVQLFKDYQEKVKKIKACTPLLEKLKNNIPEDSGIISWFIGATDGANQTKSSLIKTIEAMNKTIEKAPNKKYYEKGLKKQIESTYTALSLNIKKMLKETKRQRHAPIAAPIARATSSLSNRGKIKNTAYPIVQQLAKNLNIKE